VGQSATATVNEIEQTRRRLETDVAELAGRLPAPAIWAKRLVGLAVGGGVGGSIFWFAVHRIRAKGKDSRKAKRAKHGEQAAPGRAETPVIQVVLPEWSESLGGLLRTDGWKGPALAVGSIWLALRLAEARRLRRLTKAMLAAR